MVTVILLHDLLRLVVNLFRAEIGGRFSTVHSIPPLQVIQRQLCGRVEARIDKIQQALAVLQADIRAAKHLVHWNTPWRCIKSLKKLIAFQDIFNGSLCYTILPIQLAVDRYVQRQLDAAAAATTQARFEQSHQQNK